MTGINERDATLTDKRREIIERKVKPLIIGRVQAIDPSEVAGCGQEIGDFLDEWESKGTLRYLWNDYKPSESLFVGAERAAQGKVWGHQVDSWAAPNSMRDVEPSVMFKVR
jgi:hypothetical protein|tara:strand:- start:272 stop:604 length:333 start_codon:yes stop_codon:yes gene_type:complete